MQKLHRQRVRFHVVIEEQLHAQGDVPHISLKQTHTQKHCRSRAYLVGGSGAQALPRWAKAVLLPETADWDQEIAIFKIIPQVISRLGIQMRMEVAKFARVKQVAAGRSQVCKDSLGMDEIVGKKLLNDTMGGAGLPEKLKANEFLKDLRREVRLLFWIAVMLRNDLYN